MNTNQKNRCSIRLLCRAALSGGFSLVELLVTIGIIIIVLGLAAPVMNSLKGAGDITRAAYEIKGALDQARTWAVANNTYVWVGFFEENGGESSKSPAVEGVGRVVIAAVAAKNGLRGYNLEGGAETLDAGNLVPLGKLQKFDGLHLGTLNGDANQGIVGSIPATSGMARPAITSNNYDLGQTDCRASTWFGWPVQGASQYTFSKVIEFDPQGIARIQYASNRDFIPLHIEVGLQGAHGNVAQGAPADQTHGRYAALQINGMTGAVRIYRP